MADPVGLQAWLPSTPGNQFQLPSGDSPKTNSFFFFPPPLSKDTCLIMEDMNTNHRSHSITTLGWKNFQKDP